MADEAFSPEVSDANVESPTEIVSTPSANTETIESPAPPSAPQPQADAAAAAAFLDPNSNYKLSFAGQEEQLSGQQYSYLAEAGARALLKAQEQQAAGESPPTETEKANEAELADMSDPLVRVEALEKKLESLTGNVKNQEVTFESRRLEALIDEKFAGSAIFKGLGANEETKGDLADLREEVFSTALRKNVPVEKAFEAIEARTSRMLGEDRSNYLRGKLEAQKGAVEGTGGRTRSPEKPASLKEWQEDPNSLIKRTMTMLSDR